MNQSRAEKLRADALSNLKLPNSDVTEELVDSFRTFLDKTNNSRNFVRNPKPKKRKSVALDFLHSEHSSGKTNKRYFWPATPDQISQPDIVQQLSNFMLLDVNKIPRQISETGQPSKPAIQTQLVEPQSTSRPGSQPISEDKELAAAVRAMEKLDKQDLTYSEEGSDFVQVTLRDTRRVGKNPSTSPRTQLLSPVALVRGISSPTGLPTAQVRSDPTIRTPKSSRTRKRGSSSSGQIRTPPPSERQLGKRPATVTDPFNISDDEIFFSDSLLETDVAPGDSTSAEPARKRARFDEIAQNLEVSEPIVAATISTSRFISPDNSNQRLQQAPGQSVDITRPFDQGTEAHVSTTTRENSHAGPVSPLRSYFESFYPSSPRSTADVAVQCEIPHPEAGTSDRIVVDFQGLQYAQLYDLPSIFLDHLGECRRSHEVIGTNESRARAAVLRDVEKHLRKTLKGP